MRDLAALTLCLLVAIFTRMPAQAQQPGQPIFEPGFEGEIWKTRPPHPIGRKVQAPCILPQEWVFSAESGYFDAINGNQCTPLQMFENEASLFANGEGDDQMFFPAGVAVYDATDRQKATAYQGQPFPTTPRVLVADRYNNRILTFVSAGNGNWAPLHLTGADWNGFNSPYTLGTPEHIAVDAGGYLWVADLANNRIVVFTPEGKGVLAIDLFDTVYHPGLALWPYGIAVAPGSEYGVAGGRVAVIAQDYDNAGTHLIVLDTEVGAEVGRHAPDPRDDENNPSDQFDSPGELYLATGVGYQRQDLGGGQYADRLVVADASNNRIQVFPTHANGAPDPTPVLIFGATPVLDASNNPVPESQLQWPYSVLVDQRGRVLVSDSIGNRLTFFRVDFSVAQPKAQFLFELNARGGLDGVPRGIAEDASNSLYVVDTGDHEVEVFEIPELAVVDITRAPPTIRVGDTIAVEFSVMVPETKSTVPDVTPRCVSSSPSLTFLSGPTPTAGTPRGPSASGIPVTMHSVSVDGLYRYSCEFTAAEAGSFEIVVGASGPGGAVTAPAKLTNGRVVDCGTNCENEPPVVSVVAQSDAPPQNGFHRSEVTITITADDLPTPGASGMTRFYWKWLGGSAMSGLAMTNPCPDYPAEVRVQCMDLPPPSSPSASYPVLAMISGDSTLEYWAEDQSGNFSAQKRLRLAIDTNEPWANFRRTSLPTGPGLWWNHSVTFDLIYGDDKTPQSEIVRRPHQTVVTIPGEGRRLVGSITLTDLAGNAATYDSSEFEINIDKTAPVTAASTNNGVLVNNSVVTSTPANLPVIMLSVADPLLSNDDEPSGVESSSYTLDGVESAYESTATTVTLGFGPHTLTLVSKDVAGNVENRTVNFSVNAVPMGVAPIAVDDDALTMIDTPATIAVLANDREPDGQPMTIVGTSDGPSHGSLVVNVDGTITYTPAAGYVGPDTFTYSITDGSLNASAIVRVNVSPASCVVAKPGLTDLQLWQLGFDYFFAAEGRIGDLGKTSTYEMALFQGLQSPARSAQFAWANNQAEPFSLAYTASTGLVTFTLGAGSRAKTLTWTVATHDHHSCWNRDHDDDGDDDDDDRDFDVNTVLIRAAGETGYGSVFLDALALDGAPLNHPFSAPAGSQKAVTLALKGVPGSFTVTGTARMTWPGTWSGNLSRGSRVAFQIGVGRLEGLPPCGGVNTPPVAGNDSVVTAEDQAKSIDVLDDDDDADDQDLTVAAVTNPLHGSAAIHSDGTVRYTPAANYHGPDTFTYTVSDGEATAVGIVTVGVTAVNDAPTATNKTATTNEDTSVVISVLSGASDVDGDTLSVQAVSNPPNGSAIVNANGTVTYTPDANACGPDTFTFTIKDGKSGTVTKTATVTVTCVNDAPVAQNKSVAATKNGSVAINLLTGASDPDGDTLSLTMLSDSPHGTVTRSGAIATYRPDHNYVGADTFTYTLSDGRDGSVTKAVTVTVRASSGGGHDHDDDDHNHHDGDNCDHERNRNGHRRGDGCHHERRRR